MTPRAKALWLLCSLALLSASAPVPASTREPAEVGGRWTGTLTQAPGGLRSRFAFQVTLTQEGADLWGSSRIDIEGTPYYGVMRLRGWVRGDVVILQEERIIDELPEPDSYWCLKRSVLRLARAGDQRRLEGEWNSPTCSPGTLTLVPAPRRAVR
jgi:hypothetical protein